MNTVEFEAVRLTAMLAATEKWAPIYSKTPEQHAALINGEAELQLILVKFFKGIRNKVRSYVNWDHYNYQVGLNHPHTFATETPNYDINVIVNDQQISGDSPQFIKLTIGTVQKVVTAGFAASEISSNIPLGIHSTSALIQNLSTKQVAALVGKKVLDDGSIVDNPNAAYNVLDTVRNDIASSVKTSLALGETTDEATVRMADVIAPVERAELIAQTESVNAYSAGVTAFGAESNAVGKEWDTAGAEDICADNEAAGVIGFNDDFPSGDSEPTAHPRCRCGLRLVYQEEWDAGGYGD